MKQLHVGVVIPCLNEELTLAATAASLGFGEGEPPAETYLVLVDNGSTDNTLQLAKRIQAESPPGRVIVGTEPVQSYVSPRHRGNRIMRKFARSRGIIESDILLLQADADTNYAKGYVEALRKCSRTEGPNVIVEGCMNHPQDFLKDYPSYIQLCKEVDAEFEYCLSDHPDDVIIDDKNCGYRLSDYFKWGGHRREFTNSGDEIHSETSRLYIRAKRTNCRRVRTDEAVARHSTRREVECPSFVFATAGFPRELSWRLRWTSLYKGANSLKAFANRHKNREIQIAIGYRRMHLLALFFILPLHVCQSLGLRSNLSNHPEATKVLSQLPTRSRRSCLAKPGVMIEDALKFVEYAPGIVKGASDFDRVV